MKKRIRRTLFGLFAAGIILLTGFLSVVAQSIPDTFTVAQGERLDLSAMGLMTSPVSDEDSEQASGHLPAKRYQVTVSLFSIFPVKTVTVTETEAISVVPCGTPFGIKLFTDGVMVVGLSEISTTRGDRCPAAEAGVQIGDILLELNGEPVTKTEQVGEVMARSNGAPVMLKILRGETEKTISVTPVQSEFDGNYRGGIWVRDSTAGIGIITFYRPETGMFGGLGHGICDADTGNLMPLGKGEIVPVTICGVQKGRQGDAGELKGYFTDDHAVGILQQNSDAGVYGTMDTIPVTGEAVTTARKQEVHTGPAEILTTIEGNTPRRYEAIIESVDLREDQDVKNLVVRITDETLLQTTGGIVQGMSGSPILQDGKLVGAVTHVFIHDPTRGYGILIEDMLKAAGR